MTGLYSGCGAEALILQDAVRLVVLGARETMIHRQGEYLATNLLGKVAQVPLRLRFWRLGSREIENRKVVCM